MRAIDGDHLKRWIISRGLKSQLHPADIIDQIDREPTIEPRCEECEAFNKTRLLIPQPERKKGKWIDETFKPWGLVHHPYKCDQCGEHSEADSDFCPNCGADMRGEN